MKAFELFQSISNNPIDYAKKWKDRTGGKVVGYFCSYAPEELITAAGALPFRIFGSREHITCADAHLQSYCCSLVRGGLEDALSGRLSFLDGTVFPHTCDSIQRLSDIWRLNTGYSFHIDVVLPVKLDTPSAREYMEAVFRKFRRDLEQQFGPISDKKLSETVALYNNIRRHIEEIYLLRSAAPGIVSGSDLYALIKSAMVMDRNDLCNLLGEAAAELKKRRPDEKGYKRILLTGGACNHPDIYPLLENAGARVVWDDLCTGARYFSGTTAESNDPVAALAARYADRIICPAKHYGTDARGKHIVDMARRHRARGVVFLILKFCDPHSFDYPYLKAYLDAEKIPSMLLEIEEQYSPGGQLATRFESFIEML